MLLLRSEQGVGSAPTFYLQARGQRKQAHDGHRVDLRLNTQERGASQRRASQVSEKVVLMMDLLLLQSQAHITKTILEKRGDYIVKVCQKIEKDFTHKYTEIIRSEEGMDEFIGDLKQMYNMYQFLILQCKKDLQFLDFMSMGKGLAKIYFNLMLLLIYLLKNFMLLFRRRQTNLQRVSKDTGQSFDTNNQDRDDKKKRNFQKQKERQRFQDEIEEQRFKLDWSSCQHEQEINKVLRQKSKVLQVKHSNLGQILLQTSQKMNRYDYTLQFLKKSKQVMMNDQTIMDQYKHGYQIVDHIKNELLGNLQKSTKRSFINISKKKVIELTEWRMREYKQSLVSKEVQTQAQNKKNIKSLENLNMDLRRMLDSAKRDIQLMRRSVNQANEMQFSARKNTQDLEKRLFIEERGKLAMADTIKSQQLDLHNKEKQIQQKIESIKFLYEQISRNRQTIKEQDLLLKAKSVRNQVAVQTDFQPQIRQMKFIQSIEQLLPVEDQISEKELAKAIQSRSIDKQRSLSFQPQLQDREAQTSFSQIKVIQISAILKQVLSQQRGVNTDQVKILPNNLDLFITKEAVQTDQKIQQIQSSQPSTTRQAKPFLTKRNRQIKKNQPSKNKKSDQKTVIKETEKIANQGLARTDQFFQKIQQQLIIPQNQSEKPLKRMSSLGRIRLRKAQKSQKNTFLKPQVCSELSSNVKLQLFGSLQRLKNLQSFLKLFDRPREKAEVQIHEDSRFDILPFPNQPRILTTQRQQRHSIIEFKKMQDIYHKMMRLKKKKEKGYRSFLRFLRSPFNNYQSDSQQMDFQEFRSKLEKLWKLHTCEDSPQVIYGQCRHLYQLLNSFGLQ